jgi:phage gp36-like protein
MAYATRADMVKRFGLDEITGLEKESGKGTQSVTAALLDAAAEIDGYISQRYKLPLPLGKSFPVLVWLSCDIARYRLWEGKVNDEQDTVYIRYKRTVKVLEDIAAGDMSLLDEDGNVYESAGKGMGVKVISEMPPAFTHKILKMMDYGDF